MQSDYAQIIQKMYMLYCLMLIQYDGKEEVQLVRTLVQCTCTVPMCN